MCCYILQTGFKVVIKKEKFDSFVCLSLGKITPKIDSAKCEQLSCQWNSMERMSIFTAICDGSMNVVLEGKEMSEWDIYKLSQTGGLSQLHKFETVKQLRFQHNVDFGLFV